MSFLHHSLPISGEGECELCGRHQDLTTHHLIPRSRHKKARTERMFDRKEMKTRTAQLCVACHKEVHRIFEERELAELYHTIELLQAHPQVQKYIAWLRKRGDHYVPS